MLITRKDRARLAVPGVAVNSLLGKILGLNVLEAIYRDLPVCDTPSRFIESVLERFGVNYSVRYDYAQSWPTSGPLVVVSNHPFGALDGLILCHFLVRQRPDTKILANYFLQQLSELQPLLLLVDPFRRAGATSRSVGGLREALRWLEAGHVLAAFPSGTVSHFRWSSLRVEDPDWHQSVAGLVHRAKADVLPVYFHGRNSGLFQFASALHPLLRTTLIPRELLTRRDTHVQVTVGEVVTYENLAGFGSRADLTQELRARTLRLSDGR